MAFVLRFIVYREILWTNASEAHIARHGVRPEEVEDAINTGPILTRRGRNDTTEVFGTTMAGRNLVMIVAPAMNGRWYLVTARDMTDNERLTFRRKGR